MAHLSVLGAGRMGSALALAFLRAGHTVTVWNRTADKVRPLAASGARVARSLVEAAEADLIVDVVSDYDTSARLLRAPDVQRALRGRTLLELASGTPAEARAAAAWAQEHGVRYLDGAIMATPDVIGQPGCLILYAGPSSVFDAHRATLGAIADRGLHLGEEIGHASVLDNAILVVLWGAMLGMLQGAALCEAERLPLATFADSLKGTWPVIEPLLSSALARIERRRWTADETTQSTVGPAQDSARHLLAMSRALGVDASLPEALSRVFERAAGRGHRDDDIAALYEGLR